MGKRGFELGGGSENVGAHQGEIRASAKGNDDVKNKPKRDAYNTPCLHTYLYYELPAPEYWCNLTSLSTREVPNFTASTFSYSKGKM